MAKKIAEYKNGNYYVIIEEDGSKTRVAPEDTFVPAFAESCDVSLTQKCSVGCSFCYANCTSTGKHSDIMDQAWIHTVHPYTELALNGNDLDHPQLMEFLQFMKERKVFCNLTVHQIQFMRNIDLLHKLTEEKLVYGIGVSLTQPTDEFISAFKEFPNAVLHTINGIITAEQVNKLRNHNIKLLILGYKNIGRGRNHMNDHAEDIAKNMKWLYENVEEICNDFAVVSFDNISLEQLEVKRLLSDTEWEEFYMGDEGTTTFYIDAVNHTFAKSSLESEDNTYPMLDSIDEMFNYVRNTK